MTTATSITVRVPLAIRHRPGRKTVVTPMTDGVAPVATRADEKVDRSFIGKILGLTMLSPDIVLDILDGRQPAGITLPTLLARLPSAWSEQRAVVHLGGIPPA